MGFLNKLQNLLGAKPALPEGNIAPDLGLTDQDGKIWRLSDLRGRPVVIYFYPKDDTPGCTKEACSFRDNYTELSQYATLLGISRDTATSHKAFARKFNLPFPLLADTDGQTTAAYNVESGIGPLKNFPRRVSFVIDASGRIAKVFDPVDVQGHTQEVLAALKALA